MYPVSCMVLTELKNQIILSIWHIHIFVYKLIICPGKKITMQFEALVLCVETFSKPWHELVF